MKKYVLVEMENGVVGASAELVKSTLGVVPEWKVRTADVTSVVQSHGLAHFGELS